MNQATLSLPRFVSPGRESCMAAVSWSGDCERPAACIRQDGSRPRTKRAHQLLWPTSARLRAALIGHHFALRLLLSLHSKRESDRVHLVSRPGLLLSIRTEGEQQDADTHACVPQPRHCLCHEPSCLEFSAVFVVWGQVRLAAIAWSCEKKAQSVPASPSLLPDRETMSRPVWTQS